MRLLTAVSGVRVPQQAPDKHSEMSAFLLSFIGNRTPTPLVYGDAIDTAEPHWTLTSSLIYGGPSPSTGAKTNHSNEWFFCYVLGQDHCGYATMLCIRHCFPHWTLTSSLLYGGRVRWQAPDKHSEMSAFLFVFRDGPCGYATMLRIRHCGTAVGVVLLCASTLTPLYVGGRVRWQAPKQTTQTSGFFVMFYW